MLSCRILSSFPFSSMTVSALCADAGFVGIGQLDVREFPAADNALLRLDGKSIPCLHVVKVFLDDDIAAACKGRVLVAHNAASRAASPRGFSVPSTKPHDVAVFEITEALDLVGNRNSVSDAFHDLRRQLEAEVHAPGANVEEDVAGSRDGVAATGTDLSKGMKLGGTRRSQQFVPGVRAESHYAGETRLDVAELDGAYKPGEIRAEGTHGRVASSIRANAHNQKDRCASERTDHPLGKNDLV